MKIARRLTAVPVAAAFCLAARPGPVPAPIDEIEVVPAVAAGTPSCDLNGDGATDLIDAIHLLFHLFAGGPAPACPALADADGSGGTADLSDVVYILTYLFLDGPPPSPLAACGKPADCAAKAWIVDCLGHWKCECGECRPVCDFEGCGDGTCDRAGGETPESCPLDCKQECRPICDKIGTRSEGWYDPCTGQLIAYDDCAGCEATCKFCPSKSEGWYDSCDGRLIEYADCDCGK